MEVVGRWPYPDEEEYRRVHTRHETWMHFRSLDLIRNDHVRQLRLTIGQDTEAVDQLRPAGEFEAGGDQSVHFEGLPAIEHDPEFSGASSPVDTEATHTDPGSGSGILGLTLGLDIYDDLASDNPSEYQSSP
jgi:hypothetical protein